MCTDAEHGRDGNRSLNPPSGWDVALCSQTLFTGTTRTPAQAQCLGERLRQIEIPSLDALDFSTADLDGHFYLEIMHVGRPPTRIPCN